MLTDLNLKFRNTYGSSYYYDSIVTNIRLKLNIYLKQTAISSATSDISVSSITNSIRAYIRNLVDACNNNSELSVAIIIASTIASYNQYISHIDFVSLNGTFTQQIKAINTSKSNKYPLEYFTLDTTLDDNSISQIEKDILFFNNTTNEKIDA